MKVKAKIITSCFLAAALLTTATACSESTASSSDEPVAYIENPPEDAGDTFTITYDEWHSEYLFNLLRGGYTEDYSGSIIESYSQIIIDYQVQERIILYLAKKAGISAETLTQEELDTIDQNVQSSLDEWCASYEAEAAEALGGDYTEEELYEKEYELFSALLAKAGLTPDVFITWETNELIQEKFIEKTSESIDDQTVADFVQETIDTAKEMYENDLATFEQSYTAFYVPEGTRIVQQIYVKISDDAAAEVKAYRDDGDDEKADELLNEALDVVRFRIDEAYEKLQNGEDWNEVQEEYSDDTNGADVDYVVYPTSATVLQSVIDAAMGIAQKGGFSEVFTTDSGFFILYYKDDRIFSDEEMQSLLDQARDYLKEQESYQQVSDFKAEYPYVYNYELLGISEPVAE